jgi:tripartite-type tricarboxylate transporter receptor subunit TctC
LLPIRGLRRMFKARILTAAALLLGASCGLAASYGADYPAHAVRVVIGFSPGASADLTARVINRKLSQKFGQSFSVENRANAGINGAAEIVARSPKDGYTLLLGTAANVINATIVPELPFDFGSDFAPVVLIASVPQVLVVSPALGVESVRDLIALAKARPGQLTFGSGGFGTSTHLAGELFNLMAGVHLAHVPYPSTAQAVTDLLAGRVSALFAPAPGVLQHIEQGRVKALASTGAKRPGIAPNLPTMAEAGLPDYESGLWFGLLAPAGTPRDVIDRLGAAINAALDANEVRAALRVQGIDPVGGSAQDFARHIEAESRKWTSVAAAVGLKK